MDLEKTLNNFTQAINSGGDHTPPEIRLLLFCLAKTMRAERIIETGYDAGLTTLALAKSGAAVVGVDDFSEYHNAKKQAPERLKNYPDCTLIKGDALELLRNTDAESIDLIFVDDLHGIEHIRREAIETTRILKPLGIAAFHDVFAFKLEDMLKDVFEGWEYLLLSAFSPSNGTNYGLGIFKKPKQLCEHNWSYVEMGQDDGTHDIFAVSRCNKCNCEIKRFVKNE